MDTPPDDQRPIVYERNGYCPICDTRVRFVARDPWYRDHLLCDSCEGGSVPRERALMQVVRTYFPNWKQLRIHESSPAKRGVSVALRKHCPEYVGTYFFTDTERGGTKWGYRCEDLERQTFGDASFDLVVSLDVMEHVNRPDHAFREVARTLRPNGAYVFTAPTYKERTESVRRAIFHADTIEHLQLPPEYHGSPNDPLGSLVTFHYGYDLPELIARWSDLQVTVLRFHDHSIGVIGEFTEVYICRKA